MTKNTCLYTFTLESEDGSREKQIIFEIYHGVVPMMEHELAWVHLIPKDLTLVELTHAIEEYAAMYDVAIPNESWIKEQYNKLNNPQ